jgi:threonine aldolase
LWLDNARHANAMASRVAQGFGGMPNLEILCPVQANEIFVAMPESTVSGLEGLGFKFYRWPACRPAQDVAIRLVTSYVTTVEEVDGLLRATCKLLEDSR